MGSTAKRSHSVMIRRPSSPSNFTNQSRTRPPSPAAYSDFIIEVDGIEFALYKASLCARSGRIKKLVKHHKGPAPLKLELPNLPGGANAFKLAVKFCYGIKFEINSSNVAVLRCAAEHLEMTEDYGRDNLVACIELFLREAVFKSLKECVQVLCSCESILLQVEDVKLTRRCIDAVASIIWEFDTIHSNVMLGGTEKQGLAHMDASVDWWADELLPLPIDFFKQAVQAMKLRGLRAACIADALMHYARQALKLFPCKPIETIIREQEQQDQNLKLEHEQRIILETIVNLLPAEKEVVPNAFLFGLLQTGFLLDTTVACQMELEERIGSQLEHATLEELLVPSFLSHRGDGLFDVDFVHRLVVNFVQKNMINNSSAFHHSIQESNRFNSSSSQVAVIKVAKLLDSYLAEVAADANLKVTKFISLMELLPNHIRVLHDGIYRAIDIYVKAHPTLTDMDKRRICKLMDCQKLSQEACSHAAQNERLPVPVIVQVLHIEQLRRTALSNSSANGESLHLLCSLQRMGAGSVICIASPREDYASLRQENEDLRLEVTCMRTRLDYLEKQYTTNMSCVIEKTSSAKKLLSWTCSRINPFARRNSKESSNRQEHPVRAPRRRQYSIS